MTEKIYCSQCHNSAFVETKDTKVPAEMKALGSKHCLYCFVLKKFFESHQQIPLLCRANHNFSAESAEKLLRGVYKAHNFFEAMNDYARWTKQKMALKKRLRSV